MGIASLTLCVHQYGSRSVKLTSPQSLWVSSNLTFDKQVTEQCMCESPQTPWICAPSLQAHPKHPNVSYTLSFYHPLPFRLCNPSMVATVHWPIKTSWKRATQGNKTNLKLPFRCDVTYKTRLQLTNLLPISNWHEVLDIVFVYKAVNNLGRLPLVKTDRPSRSVRKWYTSVRRTGSGRNHASAYGTGEMGGCSPPPLPVGEKNSIIRAKLMYRSGKETVKKYLII